jgi:hypothetical protein
VHLLKVMTVVDSAGRLLDCYCRCLSEMYRDCCDGEHEENQHCLVHQLLMASSAETNSWLVNKRDTVSILFSLMLLLHSSILSTPPIAFECWRCCDHGPLVFSWVKKRSFHHTQPFSRQQQISRCTLLKLFLSSHARTNLQVHFCTSSVTINNG